MMGILRIAAAAALIVGAGLMHGTWTNRWRLSPELAALAARFDSVPATVGEWTSTPYEVGPRERKLAGAEACLGRVYTNAARGLTVSVLLVGGLPGDIATHTPDVCYRGAGYVLNTPQPYGYRPRAEGAPVGFRTAVAARGGVNPSALRIFWSWRAAAANAKGWAAPDDARWSFASAPALCKLYIIRETGGQAVEPDRDPCNDFLEDFLPALDRSVFAAPG